VAALIAEIRHFKETTVAAVMQDTFLLISHSLDHVERLARGQAQVASVAAELKESLIEMEQIRNELQDCTSQQQDLAQRVTSSELEKLALEATTSTKIAELEARLDTERAEREKERRALSVKHSNTVVINQTNHTVEIEKAELERISLQVLACFTGTKVLAY
jgi:predicted Holliday junction resolvase-like endonuclease